MRILIDDVTIAQHFSLSEEDECYYYMDYKKHEKFISGSNSSRITNFKKPLSKAGTLEWGYKGKEINKMATMLRDCHSKWIDYAKYTLVPIPPSMHRDNPLHDDRMLQTLNISCAGIPYADVRELLLFKDTMRSSHGVDTTVENRPSKLEIKANLTINESLTLGVRDSIILYDDVITAGTHFKACKEKLLSRFPGKKVMGIFLARTIHDEKVNIGRTLV